MQSNTIKKLCKSNRYHYSIKANLHKTQQLNSLFDTITQNLVSLESNCITSNSEKESLVEKINEEIALVGLTELNIKGVRNLMMGDVKTIGSRLCRIEQVSVSNN